MLTWLFGKRTYSYPWLRWVCVPSFRLGILLLGISIAIRGHTTWVSSVGVGLMGLSLSVDAFDLLSVRFRRRQHQPPS